MTLSWLKFEFERSRAKVKVTLAILRKKHCYRFSALIYRPILVLYHINI